MLGEQKPFKIIATARDPRAAEYLSAILLQIADQTVLDFYILSQSPATEILNKHGITPNHVPNMGIRELCDLLTTRCLTLKPDAAIVGLSGPGVGIDEALVSITKGKIPTFAIQDTPGSIGASISARADVYLVENSKLSGDLHDRISADAISIGYALFNQLQEMEAHYKKTEKSKLLSDYPFQLDREGNVTTFIGQPLWSHVAYSKTISQFLQSYRSTFPNKPIGYRPHPKESQSDIQSFLDISSENDVVVVQLDHLTLVETLAVTDKLITCFSTFGEDAVRLSGHMREPVCSVIYLLWDSSLRQYLSSDTGKEIPWPAQVGHAMAVTQKRQLKKALGAKPDYMFESNTTKISIKRFSPSIFVEAIQNQIKTFRQQV